MTAHLDQSTDTRTGDRTAKNARQSGATNHHQRTGSGDPMVDTALLREVYRDRAHLIAHRDRLLVALDAAQSERAALWELLKEQTRTVRLFRAEIDAIAREREIDADTIADMSFDLDAVLSGRAIGGAA